MIFDYHHFFIKEKWFILTLKVIIQTEYEKQCSAVRLLNTVLVECCVDTANGEPVAGVTTLAGEIYLLRRKELGQVEVYDVITYRLQRYISVPNARKFTDITSCEHYHCVYIGDDIVECIHRLDGQGTMTRWAVNDEPRGISINALHNVLVTCHKVHKIKEFSSRGELLQEHIFPEDIINPWHAIQTRCGQFIVCHGDLDNSVHRVCMMSTDCSHIVHSHGGQRGSHNDEYIVPNHLAVDDNECVFVADRNNRRVTLLSPTLEYINVVVSGDQLKGNPCSLYLSSQRRRRHIYVAVNELTVDGQEMGRVAVFNV